MSITSWFEESIAFTLAGCADKNKNFLVKEGSEPRSRNQGPEVRNQESEARSRRPAIASFAEYRAKRGRARACRSRPKQHSSQVVIEHTPLEDELGDVLDKAMRHAGVGDHDLARKAQVPTEKIRDAIDYRPSLDVDEIRRLAVALGLNELGLCALAQGRYPLPEIAGLPFCLYPLRTPHGIGVANAYIVADCALSSGILFDTGVDYTLLRRVWPKNIRKIDAIFVTHPEAEHVGGLRDTLREFGAVPVFAPNGSKLEGAMALVEGGKLSFGGFEVNAIESPGHSEAHNCYVVRVPRAPTASPLLVSGDLLFAGSTGGAYFCKDRLMRNLRRIFEELPPATVVAPGHGPLTTLRHEKQFNPFIY